ncbi:MAG: DNA-formamidopyrimidine glycosylase family protein [Actinomycetota bacterium]
MFTATTIRQPNRAGGYVSWRATERRVIWDVPDGDTIHRAASALRTALAGAHLTRFEAPKLVGPVPRAGRVIERVERRGKHLEIEFDDGLVLHTHLKMSGTWHLYRPGDPWRRPHGAMRALIETDDWMAVCFGAPLVETYRAAGRGRHPAMGRLGPDLCRHDADLRQVVDLLLSYPNGDEPLADVLLDQRVMGGVGNVYRCEILWANELSPFAPVRRLGQHDAIRLVNSAAHVLRTNLEAPGHGRAGSSDRRRHSVYGRNGQRCGRCGETIAMRQLGLQQRLLYWCPGCQTHLDPRHEAQADDTPTMDPHPAAQMFIADLPWNRDAG